MALSNVTMMADVCPENSLGYPGWRVAAVCHLGVLMGFATVFIYSFSLMMGLASLSRLTPHLCQFYLNAVLIGVAGSGTYQPGYARVVTSWFERRLGASLSIVVAVGMLFLPAYGYAARSVPAASESLSATETEAFPGVN